MEEYQEQIAKLLNAGGLKPQQEQLLGQLLDYGDSLLA
jgi:hypothetical protein